MDLELLYFMYMKPTQRLDELNIKLPPVPGIAGLYKPVLIDGDLLYFSGHLPILHDGELVKGKVGESMTAEEGKETARLVGLNILASIHKSLGSIDHIERVIKILGMVNASNDFTEHPKVINGCSELFKELWGEDFGVGVRSAFGVSGLPGGVPVEIEGIMKLRI
jgi:enamine deaminase RidA (YjgF/YER057c/UK114 family)